MFNPETTKLSFYNRTTNTTPKQSLTLYQVYRLIVGEGENYPLKSLTEELRSLSNTDPEQEKTLRRDFKKNNLPAISFGGEFSKRSNQKLLSASNLVCLDFDHIGTGDELESIKQRISEADELDPVLLFTSPSGDGLKVVVNIRQDIKDDSDFKETFNSLRRFCQEVLNLSPDESRKDISGLCYLPYDGNAILKTSGSGFDVVKWRPIEEKTQVPVRTDRPLRETMNLTDGPDDYERALIAVEDIENSGLDITSDRQEWRDIGFALASLGEDGRELFHRVSCYYPTYNRNETDSQFSSFLRGRSSNPITLDSLFYIASKHGVKMRSSNVYAIERNKANRQASTQNPTNYPTDMNNPVKTAENGSGEPNVNQSEERQKEEFLRKVQNLLTPTTETEIIERESRSVPALRTGYFVEDKGEGQRMKLLLCSGKLTTIAGATGHGKSLFLMNLLLNVAKGNPDKRFVLFTYEENSDTILEYLLNIYLNDLDLRRNDPENSWRTNRVLIKGYFSGKGTDKFNQNSVPDFNRRKEMFFKNYIENGRILVKYIDSDSTELCQFIKALSVPENNIGGIFVDYFQCINPDPSKRFPSRQEALKSICFELKDIANETQLPVVLACQFNQEVCSPTDVLVNKIGEAGDISRISAECWGLWQMGKDITRKLDNREEMIVNGLTLKSDEMHDRDPYLRGMYLRTLKTRIATTSSEMMFEFRGLNGKIYPNDTEEKDIILNDWERPHPSLNLSDDDDLPEA